MGFKACLTVSRFHHLLCSENKWRHLARVTMYRQSSSRTHRSKGMKIKHVLQICLLLAVCFWLIYQVKHSHDKKKEFDESDSKTSLSRGSSNEILTLGRKDIRPRVEETVKNEKHDEAAIGQESIEEEEEVDDKHEEHEQEIKNAEQREDEGVEGGDEEINEHEHEKSDAEIDREEEFINEEKEGDEGGENSMEEKDSEENNGETEKEGSIEDSDHDGDEHSAREAREEHYKADDASSAVAHDNQIVDPENENGSSEYTKEQPETNILERENKENGEEINLGDKKTDLEVRDGDMAKSDNQSNITTNLEWKNKEKGEEINLGDKRTNLEVKDGNMSKSDDQSNVTTNEAEENLKEKSENSLLSNTTLTEGSNDHIETSNNSLEVRMESRQNGIESKLELNHGQNGTTTGEANNSTSDMDSNHVDSNSTIPPKNKDLESSSSEFSDSSNDSESSVAENIRSELSVDAGSNAESLTVKNDATEAEKSDTNGGTDEFSDKTSEEVQHDPIDLSDMSNSLDEKDVLPNHETLPEIRTAGTSIEDAAAE
ncbi:unnamed protein product [Fraxinus pennsylvanica]|uniref:Uncharacterized protein n=1 Tax=Fraxinus pennsylvanica TaxID=56036 RepID=A0AAD1ZLI1_9LAMI|nr:unnamed protein product [Fraxinus pennsylvanica]